MFNNFVPMTGFEPRTSGIGSDRSTNWATTTALVELLDIVMPRERLLVDLKLNLLLTKDIQKGSVNVPIRRLIKGNLKSTRYFKTWRYRPMQWLEVIMAWLDHRGAYRWSDWPRYVGTRLLPHPNQSSWVKKVNLALGLFTSWLRLSDCMMETCLLLAGVGGPWALVTSVKAIWVGVGL